MLNWFDSLNTTVGFLASAIGLYSGVFAMLAWLKARKIRSQQIEDEHRRSEPIQLILVSEDRQEYVLGYRPRRDQATRNEILGILGMYSGESRFDSSRLVPVLVSGEFDQMVAGVTDRLRFAVSNADFARLVQRDKDLAPKP